MICMPDRNANRPGYKPTPLGWIPEEWGLPPLDRVASVQTGVAKGRTNLTIPVSRPYLRVANVQDGYLDLSEVKEIAVEADEVARYSLRTGDVLFTEGGDFDKLGRGTIWRGEVPVCLHQNHVFAVRCHEGRLLPDHLAALASSPYGRRYFAGCSKQSTNLASINSGQLRRFPLPLPPLPEQRRIVAILSTWDEALSLTRQRLEAARDRKRALMQRLLTGQVRIPQFGGMAWRHARMRDLFEPVSRVVPEGFDDVLSITATVGFVHQREKFSKVIAGRNLENYTLLRRGEFAYNRGNSDAYPQGCVYVMREYDEAAVPGVYVSFRARGSDACPEFFAFYFELGLLNRQLQRVINSGVRNDGLPNLAASDFLNLEIAFPTDAAEQRAIAEVLATADAEVRLLEGGLAALDEQKRGLMQKLLTGEVRVRP